MAEKAETVFKFGKTVHIFTKDGDPTKLVLTIGRFEGEVEPIIAGIEMDEDKTKRLIRMLTAKLRQIEKAKIEGKGGNEDA